MLTCRKIYRDIPFAHRQHLHDGHCALVHGHNWAITVTLGCHEVDENGFVYDFGKLRFLRDWIDKHLDHACVLSQHDPLKDKLVGGAPELFKLYLLENTSCEGLAKHLFEVFDKMIRNRTSGRVFLVELTVEEDSRNSACWRPAPHS
jgi:6-pyruvoyltetrahydropterin/6-carboxytetrahydropterin synthase